MGDIEAYRRPRGHILSVEEEQQMAKLYKNGDRYYRMVQPVGRYDRDGCRHYALWQPIRKFLWFWINNGERFWLDMDGFEEVK